MYITSTRRYSQRAWAGSLNRVCTEDTSAKRKISCEYDELSENNLLNIIIKTAVMKLIKFPDVDREYIAELKREMRYFGGVDTVEPARSQRPAVQYQRNNGNYRMLIGISEMVIEEALLTTEAGGRRLAKFDKNQQMSRLYEKFILEFYRKHYPYLGASPAQVKWDLDEGFESGDLPQMKTDITLTDRKSGRVLIIDAKYYTSDMQEQFGTKTLRSAHLYQIYSYVKNKAAELSRSSDVSGMLLYAATDDPIQPNGEYSIGGNRFIVRTLDLNREFGEIARQLKEIVEELRGEAD